MPLRMWLGSLREPSHYLFKPILTYLLSVLLFFGSPKNSGRHTVSPLEDARFFISGTSLRQAEIFFQAN